MGDQRRLKWLDPVDSEAKTSAHRRRGSSAWCDQPARRLVLGDPHRTGISVNLYIA